MFTGIIESLVKISSLKKNKGNLHISFQTNLAGNFKIDQSISHNGVCLTVIAIDGDKYTVTAIKETLEKTNLGNLKIGDWVNIERSLKLGDRLDGHIVQGHVDQAAKCIDKIENDGSYVFFFSYDSSNNMVVEKGSICVNGVSLTVVDSKKNEFSVAIIPFTFNHTNFKTLRKGDLVNLEFDIVGKYITEGLKKDL